MKFILTALFVTLTAAGAVAKTAPKKQTEESLINTVEREYKKYGQHVSGLKPGCYSFEAEVATSSVTQREVHNAKCGGDASSSPAIAHYEVKKGRVFIEDPVSGKALPFDKNYRSDGP